MKKKAILLFTGLFLATSAVAQLDDNFGNFSADFQRFRDSIFTDFENFRQRANAEYARFMEEAWKPFNDQPAIRPPEKPKPPQPVPAPPALQPTEKPVAIPFSGKPIAPKPIERPQPVEPIPLKPAPDVPQLIISFFNTPLSFHFDTSRPLHLKDATERQVAKLWKQLSEEYYDNLVAECLKHRDERNLCDWAYLILTEQVAEACCNGHTNEAVVLHMYLLTQSGYQMRLGRTEDQRLFVLVGSHEEIYRQRYFVLEGVKYYNFDNATAGKPCHVFDHAFPKEKTMSLLTSQPRLNVEPSEPRTIASERYDDAKATVTTNQNLIDFFNSYPLSANWHYYSAASLSETAKATLYPVLRKAVEGLNQAQAANVLVNFVQTGFDYATDDVQFGYERPLFPDESLYYPFCDCEDRSILYSCLVRELLGLDVVLLDYPEHIATAVRFTEDVGGDYLFVDGLKYVICDPTYIGASIGMCMPKYKTVEPVVVKQPKAKTR